MNKASKRSARYFYFLMKVLYENRDKLAVKMNKPADPSKIKHVIAGVNVIYDDQVPNQTVVLDVREVGAFNSYQIEII